MKLARDEYKALSPAEVKVSLVTFCPLLQQILTYQSYRNMKILRMRIVNGMRGSTNRHMAIQ
jgi:hypothetical protein